MVYPQAFSNGLEWLLVRSSHLLPPSHTFPVTGLHPSRTQLKDVATQALAYVHEALGPNFSTEQSHPLCVSQHPLLPCLWVPLLMLPGNEEEGRPSHQEPKPSSALAGELRKYLCWDPDSLQLFGLENL